MATRQRKDWTAEANGQYTRNLRWKLNERTGEYVQHKFPDVRIDLRADAGFAGPRMYELGEELQIDYTIAIGMNSVLKKENETLLAEALTQYEKTQQPQCLFTTITYQAGSWPEPRQVAIECEAGPQGTNRRAVVSNRPGITVLPAGVYGDYADHGESENRNKELKCELGADRAPTDRRLAALLGHEDQESGSRSIEYQTQTQVCRDGACGTRSRALGAGLPTSRSAQVSRPRRNRRPQVSRIPETYGRPVRGRRPAHSTSRRAVGHVQRPSDEVQARTRKS